MRPRGRLGALALGVTTFLAALALGMAAMPGAEVEAEPAAPAAALARVGKMNADANALAAQRARRESPSAL
ncbi:hypothetical protein [Sphingosinicella sp.]|uniref:hypothetical protein n=1 Tax=Sphingosinicella sp. TaxID=1917971 RepID=UPI0040381455